MQQRDVVSSARARAPRAGAIAGIAFSILLITGFVLIRSSVPDNPQDAGSWLSGGWKTVRLGLHLVPFSGVAFLWFIGVLRDRMGEHEDQFFATVFLGSGLLFLAMLFASSAVAGGILVVYGETPGKLMDSGIYTFGRITVHQIIKVYAMKMAGVFMISTCTLSLRTGIFPRWMAMLGYALALFLLLSGGTLDWAPVVFPLWVLLISVYILLANLKGQPQAGL